MRGGHAWPRCSVSPEGALCQLDILAGHGSAGEAARHPELGGVSRWFQARRAGACGPLRPPPALRTQPGRGPPEDHPSAATQPPESIPSSAEPREGPYRRQPCWGRLCSCCRAGVVVPEPEWLLLLCSKSGVFFTSISMCFVRRACKPTSDDHRPLPPQVACHSVKCLLCSQNVKINCFILYLLKHSLLHSGYTGASAPPCPLLPPSPAGSLKALVLSAWVCVCLPLRA